MNRILPFTLALISFLPFCAMWYLPLGGGYIMYVMVFVLMIIGAWSVLPRDGGVLRQSPTGWWVLGLIAVILIQQMIQPAVFYSSWLPLTIGLFMLAVFCFLLAQFEDKRVLFRYLVCGLVAGAAANAFFALAQMTISLLDDNNLTIYGFLNQRNNYADYLALGLLALAWIKSEKVIPARAAIPLALLISLGLCISGSRSGLLFSLIILTFGFGWFFARGKACAPFLKWAGLFGLLAVAMFYLAPWLVDGYKWLLNSTGTVELGFGRVHKPDPGTQNSSHTRVVLILQCWDLLKANPFFGVGWDRYTVNQQALIGTEKYMGMLHWGATFFSHSHNAIAQIMAENGWILGGGLLAGLMAVWAAKWRQWQDSVVLCAVGLFAILATHSLLEFPLWYFHFLVVFMLISALSESGRPIRLANGCRALRVALLAVLVAGIAISALSVHWFWKMSKNGYPGWIYKDNLVRLEKLQTLQGNPFFDFDVAKATVDYLAPESSMLGKKFKGIHVPNEMAVLGKINAYRPSIKSFVYEAIGHERAGNPTEADRVMRQAANTFPNDLQGFASQIENLNRSLHQRFIKQHNLTQPEAKTSAPLQ